MTTFRRARVFDGERMLPGLQRLEVDAAGVLRSMAPEASDDRGPTAAAIQREQPEVRSFAAGDEHDCDGRLVTPGLVDCHTHLVWGGDRQDEFGMRLRGATYEEIMAAGGGIHSTVRSTRAASDDELFEAAQKRLQRQLMLGVTAVEIKSGYGMSVAEELRALRVIRRLRQSAGQTARQTVVPTLLAHVIPPERKDDRDNYVREFCEELIPAAVEEKLAVACDVFCESGAYTLDETRRVFEAAQKHDLALRIHSDQLTHTGGTKLAAGMGAASADHLEHIDADDIAAMAKSGSVAVLLPGAEVTLNTASPPAAALRDAGVPIALATDCNPGSSHTLDLRLMMWLGCLRYRLTPEETLAAVTGHAGRALGLPADAPPAGRLVVGQPANMLLWNTSDPAALVYRYGESLLDRVFLSPPSASVA